MKSPAQKLGAEAEVYAQKYLKSKKYRIIETNYRNTLGEIDIIAKDGSDLVFIEVKALSKSDIFDPIDHITPKKQKKLLQMAQSYTSILVNCIDQRIDIILVYCNKDPWTIDHIKNAIEA